MFGLTNRVVGVPSIERVELRFVPADDSFMGDSHEEVEVRGFDVNASDGRVLRLSDTGTVAEGVFHLRLAEGVAHPRSGEFDALEEVLLMPRRGASSGGDAIEVIDRGEVVGTVPRSLVPGMLVDKAGSAGGPSTGPTGLVVKSFHRQGHMVGCELLAVADGYGIEITSRAAARPATRPVPVVSRPGPGSPRWPRAARSPPTGRRAGARWPRRVPPGPAPAAGW